MHKSRTVDLEGVKGTIVTLDLVSARPPKSKEIRGKMVRYGGG